MSARKIIILVVIVVPVLFVSCLVVLAIGISEPDPYNFGPGSQATDEEILEYLLETNSDLADAELSEDQKDRLIESHRNSMYSLETWEYLRELAPILADYDWWDEEHRQYSGYLTEAYRIRFARPWSTATDEEIWEYILEVEPMMTVTQNPDEDGVAALIESYRAHGAPRDPAEGRPGPDATVEEIWDYFLDLYPGWVLTDSEIVASHIRQYLTEPEALSCCPRSSGRDVPAGMILRTQAYLNANPTLLAVATRVAVNTAVAMMTAPTGPVTTPADLVDRIEDGVVRVAGGSGFIFDVIGETAFVATNHHVINGIRDVQVVVKNRETYDALTLGWDSARDVAVLSICCSHDFRALPWDAAAEPEIGDTVVAVGYPQGDRSRVTATVGEISESDAHSSTYDLIPHTAPLNPGNSGGPVFSMPDSKVLGINTARGIEFLRSYAVPFRSIESQVVQWRSQLVSPR